MPSARRILFALFAFFAANTAAHSDVVVDRGSEIVLPNNAAYATRLAAAELNFFLKGVLGEALPVVAQRTEGKTAILLGGAQGRGGLATPQERDGYVIEATGDVVCIVGNDDDQTRHAFRRIRVSRAFRRRADVLSRRTRNLRAASGAHRRAGRARRGSSCLLRAPLRLCRRTCLQGVVGWSGRARCPHRAANERNRFQAPQLVSAKDGDVSPKMLSRRKDALPLARDVGLAVHQRLRGHCGRRWNAVPTGYGAW